MTSPSDLEHYEWRSRGRKLDCVDSLTEFAPIVIPQDSEASRTSTLNRASALIYKAASTLVGETTSGDSNQNLEKSEYAQQQESLAEAKHTILQRITSILDRGGKVSSSDLNDAEFKQFWMPDGNCKECYDCGLKFSAFKRRHHCRICGQIFCSNCCNLNTIKQFKEDIDLRVCQYCAQDIDKYLKSKDNQKICEASVISSVRRTSRGFREEAPWLQQHEKKFVLVDGDECDAIDEEYPLSGEVPTGEALQQLWKRVMEVFPYETTCGSDLVTWMVSERRGLTRAQATNIGQALIDAGCLEADGQAFNQFFDATILYRPVGLSTSPLVAPKDGDNPDPLWVSEIAQDTRQSPSDRNSLSDYNAAGFAVIPRLGQKADLSSFSLNLNVKDSMASISRSQLIPDPEVSTTAWSMPVTVPMKTNDDTVNGALVVSTKEGGATPENKIPEVELNEIRHTLEISFSNLEKEMINQQLAYHGLNQSWAEVISPIVHKVAGTLFLTNKIKGYEDANVWDVRQFVHIKRIPGGSKKDSSIIWGEIFNKNVVHKEMSNNMPNPKIMLLAGSISYQRNEYKIDNLEPMLMQEQDYVKHVTAKIKGFAPHILVVERSVSWLVRDNLRNMGVSLITNVKPVIMERLARLTGASVMPSLDALGCPVLGRCDTFCVMNFRLNQSQSKALSIFSGCPESLGCSVLLRGGSDYELTHVKKIVRFMVHMCYSWRMEKAFLAGELAVPPIKSDLTHALTDEGSEQMDTRKNKGSRPPLSTQSSVVVEIKKLEAQEVQDNSDPLRSNDIEYIISPVQVKSVSDEDKPYSHASFRNILNSTVLSTSPFTKATPPYLETPVGSVCHLRQYLPYELYTSEKLRPTKPSTMPMKKIEPARSGSPLEIGSWSTREDIEILEPHPYISLPTMVPFRNSRQMQALRADFLARGMRIRKKCPHEMQKLPMKTKKPIMSVIVNNNNVADVPEGKDCFSPYNHQRMVLLFGMYSKSSKNSPGYCFEPNTVIMEYYGRNDITLGAFLERHCLKYPNDCPSETCNTSVLHHTRKFVHDAGCIQIILHSLKDMMLPTSEISMWSWCRRCRFVSNVSTLSTEAWHLSFAKYLELRFHASTYTCRSCKDKCPHSLHHDHYQYFGQGMMVAVFKYSPISIREIAMPPLMICIKPQKLDVSQVSDEIKELSEKSSEFHQAVMQALANLRDQVAKGKHEDYIIKLQDIHKEQMLKSKDLIEQLNVKLTTPEVLSMADPDQNFSETLSVWTIHDALVLFKQHVAEATQTWNGQLNNFEAIRKREDKSTPKSAERSKTSGSSVSTEISVVGPLDNDSVDAAEIICDPTRLIHETAELKKNPSQLSVLEFDGNLDDTVSTLDDSSRLSVRSIDEVSTIVDAKQEKKSTNLFHKFLGSQSASIINSPFPPSEHYNLGLGLETPFVLYESEPSTIITVALASSDYQAELVKIQTQISLVFDHIREVSPNRDIDILEVQEFNLPTSSTDPKAKTEPVNLHVDLQFYDAASKFYCRIYFAEHFRKLRSLLFPAGETRFLYSLSRCVPWLAQGGKSGSTFCKTTDDRFILKELNKQESECFRSEFGLKYFEYISKAVKSKHPTVLAKVVGVYRIGWSNSITNAQCKMDLLVMENLFYDKHITQKFDLKGSERNRFVDNIQREDVVLLDENFMEQACDNPLYVRQHSKKVLLTAIGRDASFLSTCKVMDYSMLVGIDEKSNEFVVGIIDYIRPFTWDKKAEMFVKSAISGKAPTVTWPSMYKRRFELAMNRYFLCVPDRWTHLGNDSITEEDNDMYSNSQR